MAPFGGTSTFLVDHCQTFFSRDERLTPDRHSRHSREATGSFDEATGIAQVSVSAGVNPSHSGAPVPAASDGDNRCWAGTVIEVPLQTPPTKDGVVDVEITYSLPQFDIVSSHPGTGDLDTILTHVNTSPYFHLYNSSKTFLGRGDLALAADSSEPGSGIRVLRFKAYLNGWANHAPERTMPGQIFLEWYDHAHAEVREYTGNTTSAEASVARTLQLHSITLRDAA